MTNRVLILEDSEDFCYLLKDLLSAQGYEIICCADMELAQQILCEQSSKIVTLDWNSTIISCNEAFRKIGQVAPAIPVVRILNKPAAVHLPAHPKVKQPSRMSFRLLSDIFKQRISDSKPRKLVTSD